jgi:hypothetical protein
MMAKSVCAPDRLGAMLARVRLGCPGYARERLIKRCPRRTRQLLRPTPVLTD